MRLPMLMVACLAVPCLLLAQMVSSVPILDDNNRIQAFGVGDWPVDAFGDGEYLIATDKREKARGQYCMDWIHNTWRRCRGRNG
ncbi:uncharacterized protein LOC110982624 [Acanthaster planci]|uniref:Uncharacterized protein LOC110982624 n=1 Tax=Acanthaster planci TaxID=133434 RepID=A0A8B7Z0A8_ACAPL|nr:uncharacterized protein LOC110982624 [Acanthaster planci]